MAGGVVTAQGQGQYRRTAPQSASQRVQGIALSTPEVHALWLLTAVELLALVALRRYFKTAHGG